MIITLVKGNKPKDEPKVGKAHDQKGAKKVPCANIPAQWRSGSYHKTLNDVQAIQHGLEKVPEQKNDENKLLVARIEGGQRVLTGTNPGLQYISYVR